MSDGNPRDEILWEVGWQGHESAQRRRLAAMSLAEKLRWLEEAQKLAVRLQESRRKLDEERGG